MVQEAAKQAAREQRTSYFKSPTPDDGKGSGGEEVGRRLRPVPTPVGDPMRLSR